MSGVNDSEWGGGGWGASLGSSGDVKPPKRGCFNCGEEGHSKGDCPQPLKARACFNCGEEGHAKADCLQPSKGRACFNCGDESHSKADCPQPSKGRACFKCGEEGHSKADCPNSAKDGAAAVPRGCFKCGSEDHVKADCPMPDQCRNCGETGHTASECTGDAKTHKVMGKDGKEIEIYVPTENDVDDLFKQSIHCGIHFEEMEKIEVEISGENVPPPINSFENAGLRELLVENVKKSGYKKPTPIQKRTIPAAMAKRDIMGCAQTGSGKTAAFLLPILHSLLESGVSAGFATIQSPQAVILSPTRELAIQIYNEGRKFGASSILKTVVAYGGTSTAYQSSVLAKGCNVLVGTPGRIKDFVQRGKIDFSQVQFLVLDEADRLLDMGFSEVIKEIVSTMPPKGSRVTMMFSATFPVDVQAMAKDYLESYIFIMVGMVGAANKDVTQVVLEVTKFKKREKLLELVGNFGSERTLVFVETKKMCDIVAIQLCTEGFMATSIHGDRYQRERELALGEFKSGRRNILVATNVAARGLDIAGVENVINFDLPSSIDEYVHRIGRTGRVGNTGNSISFFDSSNPRDIELAPNLLKVLSDSGAEVPDFLTQYCHGAIPVAYGGTTDIRENVPTVVEDEW